MSFGGFNDQQNTMPMAEINVTPMVDVMLVLLVIFIMAAPLFTHAIKLDLPSAQSAPSDEKPQTVTIAVDPAGKLFWNDAPVSRADLTARLTLEAAKKPQPDVMIRADKNTRYEVVTDLLAAAQTQGLSKIGFVTAPHSK
ncbi:MAG: biopolymer transporter ExbD [Herbaspirillum sp.]|jgi:biopolymer transport protein ExbD|nr:biopolymer transporter ExbD [Herbaspirillum sp.]